MIYAVFIFLSLPLPRPATLSRMEVSVAAITRLCLETMYIRRIYEFLK